MEYVICFKVKSGKNKFQIVYHDMYKRINDPHITVDEAIISMIEALMHCDSLYKWNFIDAYEQNEIYVNDIVKRSDKIKDLPFEIKTIKNIEYKVITLYSFDVKMYVNRLYSEEINTVIKEVKESPSTMYIFMKQKVIDALKDISNNTKITNAIKISAMYEYICTFGIDTDIIEIILDAFKNDYFGLYGFVFNIGFHIEEIWNVIKNDENVSLLYKKNFLFMDDLEQKIKNNDDIEDYLETRILYYSDRLRKVCKLHKNDASDKILEYVHKNTRVENVIF